MNRIFWTEQSRHGKPPSQAKNSSASDVSSCSPVAATSRVCSLPGRGCCSSAHLGRARCRENPSHLITESGGASVNQSNPSVLSKFNTPSRPFFLTSSSRSELMSYIHIGTYSIYDYRIGGSLLSAVLSFSYLPLQKQYPTTAIYQQIKASAKGKKNSR